MLLDKTKPVLKYALVILIEAQGDQTPSTISPVNWKNLESLLCRDRNKPQTVAPVGPPNWQRVAARGSAWHGFKGGSIPHPGVPSLFFECGQNDPRLPDSSPLGPPVLRFVYPSPLPCLPGFLLQDCVLMGIGFIPLLFVIIIIMINNNK